MNRGCHCPTYIWYHSHWLHHSITTAIFTAWFFHNEKCKQHLMSYNFYCLIYGLPWQKFLGDIIYLFFKILFADFVGCLDLLMFLYFNKSSFLFTHAFLYWGKTREMKYEARLNCIFNFHFPCQVLADNLIERLPMNLGKLQSLKVMILDGNQITALPDECNSLI